MLVALNSAEGGRVEAGHAVKGPSYNCPGCKGPVTLAKGRIRRAYFGHRPGAVCSYFDCISNFSNGSGYMEECNDGTYSMSGGRRGACSYHHGERRPLFD